MDIKDLLLRVDKPSRYCGGEYNTPIMKDVDFKFLMCFPDVYEVAMSNLGIKILYSLLNERADAVCERCFTPWLDMIELLKSTNTPIFSLETHRSMSEFNIVGFSLQYELSYTNVLLMLELGHIPLKSIDRAESDPIIVAGGPCTINPAPINQFIDIFVIGDGEEITHTLVDVYKKNKQNNGSKMDYFRMLDGIDGIYIPQLDQGKTVRRALIADLDNAYFPTKLHIPNIEAVHNRAVLEIFRGCTRGCRFCQAGIIYRPVRERSVETLTKLTTELIVNNGFDELSLSSLSTCDYPYLRDLLSQISPIAKANNVTLALPSTRVDSFEADFIESSRKSSLTFAPEAGTQRLRDVINKNVSESDIMNSLEVAFSRGYSHVKLYFMIGLPTETQEDIAGIVDLAHKIRKVYREHSISKKPMSLSISTSTFIPKPFTPFQWEKQISLADMTAKQDYLRDNLRKLGVKYNWHEGKTSVIEAVFARGDEKLNDVILHAYQSGCFYDGWSEQFDYDKWIQALTEKNIDVDEYIGGFELDEQLPWDFISVGVTKDFLLRERNAAYNTQCTPDCRGNCHNCGINSEYKDAFKANCVGGKN